MSVKRKRIVAAVTATVEEYLPFSQDREIAEGDSLQAKMGCDSTSLVEIFMDVEERFDVGLFGNVPNDPTIIEIVDFILSEQAK